MTGRCTPEYNDETKKMLAAHAEMSRIHKALDTNDFGSVIRAKAKEFTDAGETDPLKVVDKVHEFVKDYSGMTKRNVADTISGYGRKVVPKTRSEAEQRMADVKAQLRDASKAADTAAGKGPRDMARVKALNKEYDGLVARIKSGDLSKPEKPASPPTNHSVQQAILKRDRAKAVVDELVAKGDRLNRSTARKVLGMVNDSYMAMILASFHVFKKLGFAVVGGHALDTLTHTTSAVLRHIPGIKGVAEKSPQYGSGIGLAEAKARLQGLKEAPGEALNQLKYGEASRESLLGHLSKSSDEYFTFAGTMADAFHTPGALNKASEVVRAAAGYVGRTHAAEKEFLSQPVYRGALTRETQFLTKQMLKDGSSPEQVAAHLGKETTQAALMSRALERAYAAKMQEPNKFTSMINATVNALEKSDNLGNNILGTLFRLAAPIRKIGVNVAVQGSSLMAGGLKAAVAAMRHRGDIDADTADYIMKNLGHQSAGIVLMAAGAMMSGQLGGVPGVLSKKDKQSIGADGKPIRAGASDVLGSEAFHGAPAAMLQVGASMSQLYQKEYGKEKGVDIALHVLTEPAANWYLRTIPYTDTARRWKNTMDYGRAQQQGTAAGIGQIVGDTAAGMTAPGFVHQWAYDGDPYKGFRKPQNMLDDIKLGIPGLREQVPIKNPPKHNLTQAMNKS